MRRTFPGIVLATVLTLALVAVPVACGSDNGVMATSRSLERGGGTDPGGEPSASADELCGQLDGLAGQEELSLDDGPGAASEAAERAKVLATGAPPEVAEALGVFADLFEQMAELEAGEVEGMDAFAEILGTMMDPAVIAAGEILSEFMVEECGIDPSEAGEAFGTDPFGGAGEFPDDFDSDIPDDNDEFGASDRSELGLDDIKAVEEAHSDATWTSKIFSTGIANHYAVQLAAPGPGDDVVGEPLTTSEAIEACEAVRTALQDRQPELTVEVVNGDTTVASGAAGVPCTAT